MEVRNNVFAYDIPWSWGEIEEPLSVHVVETDEATVLFGTGDQSTESAVLEVARDHDIDVAIAEHGDVDHFGGIPALQDHLEITVAVPAGDTEFLDEHDIAYDITLERGDTYWDIQTISVPGHTPDNMAYLYEDILIAGDTVAGSDSAFSMDGDWKGALAPLTDDLNYDTDVMIDSIPILLEHAYETVLVAHGTSALEDGIAEVQTLVDTLNHGNTTSP